MSQPETVVCLYRVAEGNQSAFEALLERHWPTLREVDLVTEQPPLHLRGSEQQGGQPLYVEIFEWRSAEGSELAHQHPAVMEIWESMGTLTESRDGRPNMEFPHFQPIELVSGG